MGIRKEVWPMEAGVAVVALVMGGVIGALTGSAGMGGAWGLWILLFFGSYMLFFFRNPDRTPPSEPGVVVAGADGRVMRIAEVTEEKVLRCPCIRISIFLSLFDVHVNRAPIGGRIGHLAYFPGKRYFTFQEKSSQYNQHSAILIEGAGVQCVVYQIVGPVARRVVYWLREGQDVGMGESIGMMKFGSRLDMYFPVGQVEVLAKVGDVVRAGETIVARIAGAAEDAT